MELAYLVGTLLGNTRLYFQTHWGGFTAPNCLWFRSSSSWVAEEHYCYPRANEVYFPAGPSTHPLVCCYHPLFGRVIEAGPERMRVLRVKIISGVHRLHLRAWGRLKGFSLAMHLACQNMRLPLLKLWLGLKRSLMINSDDEKSRQAAQPQSSYLPATRGRSAASPLPPRVELFVFSSFYPAWFGPKSSPTLSSALRIHVLIS